MLRWASDLSLWMGNDECRGRIGDMEKSEGRKKEVSGWRGGSRTPCDWLGWGGAGSFDWPAAKVPESAVTQCQCWTLSRCSSQGGTRLFSPVHEHPGPGSGPAQHRSWRWYRGSPRILALLLTGCSRRRGRAPSGRFWGAHGTDRVRRRFARVGIPITFAFPEWDPPPVGHIAPSDLAWDGG